jgi:hypothetical protein
MESVTVHTIPIKRKGEWKYFQVRLPKDAKKIIGIETGLKVQDELPDDFHGVNDVRFLIKHNQLMGDIKLQSLDDANIFYAKEIWADDRNMNTDGIIINDYLQPAERRIALLRFNPPPDLWQPQFPWKHSGKLEEDGVLLCHNPVITGIYKDAIGKKYETDFTYKVLLYIWHDG